MLTIAVMGVLLPAMIMLAEPGVCLWVGALGQRGFTFGSGVGSWPVGPTSTTGGCHSEATYVIDVDAAVMYYH